MSNFEQEARFIFGGDGDAARLACALAKRGTSRAANFNATERTMGPTPLNRTTFNAQRLADAKEMARRVQNYIAVCESGGENFSVADARMVRANVTRLGADVLLQAMTPDAIARAFPAMKKPHFSNYMGPIFGD